MKKTSFLFAGLLFLLVNCTRPVEQSELTSKISPFLFGQNLWLTDGAEGRPGYIQEHLWPKVQESGARMIRIGGNGYDQVLPGLDTLEMWVRSIKEIGAEPMIQVSKYESSEKAAQVVRYFNVDNDLRVTYWAVGNEPYIIHKYTIEEVANYIKSHASAMKAVDPTIKIFAPDEAAYDSELYEALLLGERNSIAGRDQNGNWYIDGVTFHNYPNAKDYTRSDVIFYSVSKIRGMILQLLDNIEDANEKYQRFGDDRLIWGLTEFNITYDNPDDHSVEGIAVPSFINGQFWVDVFAMAMEYDAFCVTPWCIQESDRKSTYFGYVGGPPDFIPHSTFYHMQMMSQHMSGSYVKLTTNNPYVKAFGSKDEKGSVIILMNQHETAIVDFDFAKINQIPEEGLLNIQSATPIKGTAKGTIEPNATILFHFDKSGLLTQTLKYDLDMAKQNLSPQTVE